MTSEKSVALEQRLAALLGGLDTWHNITSFSNGWGVGTGFAKRRLSSLGQLELAMQLQTPGTLTDNTQIFTLPSGYYSTNNALWIPMFSAVTGAEAAALLITTGGSVTIRGIGGTATPSIAVCAVVPIP